MIAFTQWDDVYQREVERLTARPDLISESWTPSALRNYMPGPLFQMAKRGFPHPPSGCDWGCLTMIRGGGRCVAATPLMTVEIKRDERIPRNVEEIERNLESLEVFAEWQRDIDAMFGVEANRERV